MATHSASWKAGMAVALLSMSNRVNCAFLGMDIEVDFWFWQTAIVAKSWVYIDGGEIWAYPDANSSQPVALWNENTYAIPLNTSWSTSSVIPSMASKPKGISVTRQPDAFYDAASDMVYSLGGSSYVRGGSYLTTNPRVEVQAFSTANNDGKANWELANTQGLQPVSMPAGNIKATAPDAHWSIGGYTSYITAQGGEGRYAVESIVEYNMTTGQFSNTTLPDGRSRHLYGQGVWVPFGKKGVVVMFGGMEGSGSTGSRWIDSTWQSVSMGEITIYDVDSKNFYTQKTRSPAIPTGRSSFCTVTSGSNGTYEIFVYGGKAKNMEAISDDTYADLQSVWILTLPAFTWVRSTAGFSQRSQHHCALLNDNLMLSVGGWLESNVPGTEYNNGMGGLKDPLPNGLGLFDLSRQEWVEEYTPDYTAEYMHPKIVADVYAGVNQSDWAWDDEALKAMFVTEKPLFVEEPKPVDTTDRAVPATDEVQAQVEKSTPIGAIVGGVLGGIAGLALVGFLIFLFLRRKSANNAEVEDKLEDGQITPELESPPPEPRFEAHGTPTEAKSELWTEGNYHEASVNEIHEIHSVTAPGGGQIHEIGDSTPEARRYG